MNQLASKLKHTDRSLTINTIKALVLSDCKLSLYTYVKY